MRTVCFILFSCALYLGIYSCKSSTKDQDVSQHVTSTYGDVDDASVIEYRFTDRSVPPPFHRSYTITVLQDSITVAIYDYTDILYQETRFCSNKEMKKAQTAFVRSALKPKAEDQQNGCTGGIIHNVRVHDGINEELQLYTYDCAGEKIGDMSGNIEQFAADIKALIPDFDRLMASTLK